jgi:hypothetical protein
LKSVREIRDKHSTIFVASPITTHHVPPYSGTLNIPLSDGAHFNNNSRRWSNSGTGVVENRKRNFDNNGFEDKNTDRRNTFSHPPPPEKQYVEPKSEDNNSRKMSSYLDVDAPKVLLMIYSYFNIVTTI